MQASFARPLPGGVLPGLNGRSGRAVGSDPPELIRVSSADSSSSVNPAPPSPLTRCGMSSARVKAGGDSH
jgi:hypothetical protein